MQARNQNNSQGIDVSHHQGTIDWNAVKSAGVEFAFIKASESNHTVDDKFNQNYNEAKRVSIPVGFYHFSHLSNDPIQEANFYLSVVNGYQVDLWHVLDIENGSLDNNNYDSSYICNWAKQWLDTVQNATGKLPMIYSGAAFFRDYFTSDFANYPIWIAQYGSDTPMENNVWSQWQVFQYSENGTISGITENKVDLNEFNGKIQDFLNQNVGDEDNMPMKLQEWEWKMLGDTLDAMYKKQLISDYTWAEKAYQMTMTSSELTFLNTVLYARSQGIQV